MKPQSDFFLVILLSALAGVSAYFSNMAYLDTPLLFALEGLILVLFITSTVFLRSLRRGSLVTFTALVTTCLLAVIHTLLFPKYDPVAPVAYFVVLLFSTFFNLFLAYRHYASRQALYRVYDQHKPAMAAVVVTFMVVAFVLSLQDILFQFGLLTLMGVALSYLTFLFYFAPLLRIEKWLSHTEQLNEQESRTRNFVKKYGKGKDVYPFFATWLGAAVSDVEDLIDRLEAKGYLGHNFFAIQNIFYWFLTSLSFFMGLAVAGAHFGQQAWAFLLLVTGVALAGPQAFFRRTFRRFLGVLLIVAALSIFYLTNVVAFRVASLSTLIAVVSIYFAYRDEEVISIIFASFFVGSLFMLGRSMLLPVFMRTPVPWIITLVTMMLLLHHLYVNEQLY